MKRRNGNEIGRFVKIIFDEDALNILKIMSQDTWINNFPNLIVEMINSKYDIALKAVEYAPNIYFEFSNQLKKDRQIIRKTIKSYQKHKRIAEINTKTKPLRKRR